MGKSNNQGSCVDDATRIALLELKDTVIEAVTKIVKSENNSLEKTLRELHDVRFKHLEDEQSRSFKYHEEHYSEEKRIRKDTDEKIDHLRDNVFIEINKLKTAFSNLVSKQSSDEGMEKGKDKVISNESNKKTIFWTACGVIVAVLLFFAGLAI